jgi:ABC-2 type transport system ATP-binding protein
MRTLVGLLQPQSGSWDLQQVSNIGILVDEPAMHRWLTVKSELKYWTRVKKLPMSEVERVASLVKLSDRLSSKIKSLSHGMKQRVAIAIALLGSPEVIVLDEPFNGLDPDQIDQLRAVLLAETARGATILLSTHQLDEAQRCCDTVFIINNGEIIAKKDADSSNQSKTITVANDEYESAISILVDIDISTGPSSTITVSSDHHRNVLAILAKHDIYPMSVTESGSNLVEYYRKVVSS